jgi:hypothetical protein
MSINQALRLTHVAQENRKRKFDYGEIVDFLPESDAEQFDVAGLVLIAETLLDFTGFPVANFREFRKRHEPAATIAQFLENCVLPFLPDPESRPQRRSLYQEMLSVMPAGRHSMLSAKLHLGQIVKAKEIHPAEAYLARILETKKILRGELVTIVRNLCSLTGRRFCGPRPLSGSRKDDLLQWLSDNEAAIVPCLEMTGKRGIELWLSTESS